MRRLSPEERALWGQVAGTVKPIRGRANAGAPAQAGAGADVTAKTPHRPLPGRRPVYPEPPAQRVVEAQGHIRAAHHPSANTLDGSWDKRLRLGQASPDFTIDLHGETLRSAHARLNHSLAIAIRHGARMILLITGRPARDNPRLPPTSRGVIRASVMDWLTASAHAPHIAAIRGAHPRHGGAGALYVILKRTR